ncbi:hypothetical protein OROGR_019409 [Orobanche gracilis]
MVNHKLQTFCVLLLIAAVFSVEMVFGQQFELHPELDCGPYTGNPPTNATLGDCTTCCQNIFGDQTTVNCSSNTGADACACNVLRKQGTPKTVCKK